MDELKRAVIQVHAHRVSAAKEPAEPVARHVIGEQPLTIMVEGVGEFTLMCTPIEIDALAVGFAYSEGIIDSLDDVVDMSHGEGATDVVGMQIDDPSQVATRRNLIVASSCGLCGVRTIEKTLSDTPEVGNSLCLDEALLMQMVDRLWGLQRVYPATGGAHAAAVFSPTGEVLSSAEDIGRHNALDKAIGKCLLAGRSTKGCAVALSSRASFEMVAKAARAGVELMAAASAPSSLAIDAAHRWNLTLCASIRGGEATVFTHPKRVSVRGPWHEIR